MNGHRQKPAYSVPLVAAGFLDEAHDYFDPDIMRRYREALAESDLEGGRLPDEITVEWVELGGVRTAKLNYAGAPQDKLVVHIHGGGWCGGVPCTGLQGMIAVQQMIGYNMVSLDYGLAPEHPFPDGVMDCVAAYQPSFFRVREAFSSCSPRGKIPNTADPEPVIRLPAAPDSSMICRISCTSGRSAASSRAL